MKNDSAWTRIGFVLFIVAITRNVFNKFFGFENLPSWIQLTFLSITIGTFAYLMFKEKLKMNSFQKKMAISYLAFFIVMILGFITIELLDSKFPEIWNQYRKVFAIVILALFSLFMIYILILVLKNRDKIRK